MTTSIFGVVAGLTILLAADVQSPDQKTELVISEGHETDPRDHGRPVVLIANALGVKPEVFREAFSHVTPAAAGNEPKPEQVSRNKQALLSALGPFGVTNDLLDRVSDYYRYEPGRGGLWRTKPAKAFATLSGRTVRSITITEKGSGYSSVPKIEVPGYPGIHLEAKIAFGKDLKTNGQIDSISIHP